MLKIKDNVDLKELEKFGFKPYYNCDTGKTMYYYREYTKFPDFKHKSDWVSRVEFHEATKKMDKTIHYRKVKNNKELKAIIGKFSNEFDVVEILFDLIQAGLVEKV